jgi:ankyrin repeat protein
MQCCLVIVATTIALFSSLSYAAYEQRIYYVGMSCASIQRDSAVAPANEIFIHTHVRQLKNGKTHAQSFPKGNPGYYKKVTKGFHKHEANWLIWEGKQQPVELRVTMWEHDNGGTAVQAFSTYLTAAIGRKAKGKITENSIPGGEPPSGNDPVTSIFTRTGQNLFGTEHDLIGYQRVYLGKGNWAGEPRKKRGPITYHFSTKHRKGGANCEAYFLFKRGDQYKDPVAAPNKPTPYSPPDNNQRYNTNEQPYQSPTGQNLEETRYQCKQTYDACRHEAVKCQSNFDGQYKSCIQGLKAKMDDCLEWHRKKHGRYELQKRYHDGRLSPRVPKRYPQCDRYLDTRKYCGHSKSKCPTVSECQGANSRCQSAASINNHNQQYGSISLPEQGSDEPSSTAPPTKEDRGYIIWLKNECKQAVSVAYRYKSFVHHKWVTSGWTPLEPGEKKRAPIYTENTLAYFHSDIGKIQDGANFIPIELQVVDDSFEHIQDTKLNGKNLRKMPFHKFSWRASQIANSVEIAECDTHRDKKAIEERGKDAMGEALFDIAHKHGYKRNSIDRLVKKGAPINVRNLKGETPIFVAIKSRNVFAVGGFLSNGADANAKDEQGNTPLHLAASINDQTIVSQLIKKGANVNAKNKAGKSVMDIALSKSNAEIVGMLVSAGATSNVSPKQAFKGGNTLLHEAVAKNDVALAAKLLEEGADVNALDKRGAPPLYRVGNWSNNNIAMIELLLKYKADPNIQPKKGSDSLLHRVIRYKENKSKPRSPYDLVQKEKMIKLLLDNGADINVHDYTGGNILHAIVWLSPNKTAKLMQFVSKNGIHANQQDKQKDTALHVAASRFFPWDLSNAGVETDNRIDTLLAIGVDPNIQNKQGQTALHVLLNRVIDDCLLKNNVGCRTEKELNALYAKVKLLVDKGADTNLADKKGNTPKKLADQIKNRGLRKKINALLNQ